MRRSCEEAMHSRSAIRFIVALITSLGMAACGGTADDAEKFSDRSVDESAVDQGQEAEPEESPSDDAGRPAESDSLRRMAPGRFSSTSWGTTTSVLRCWRRVRDGRSRLEREREHRDPRRHPRVLNEEIGPLGNFDGTTLVHVGREEIITAFDSGELNLGDRRLSRAPIHRGHGFPADRAPRSSGTTVEAGPALALTTPMARTSSPRDSLRDSRRTRRSWSGFDRSPRFRRLLMATFESQVQDLAVSWSPRGTRALGHGWDFSSGILRTSQCRRRWSCRGVHRHRRSGRWGGNRHRYHAVCARSHEIAQLEEALDELADVLAEADSP